MAEQLATGRRGVSVRPRVRGQALVLFALFLLVLLGASAVAVDYANMLLTDRRLQNVADHAALAGAAMFDQTTQQPDCGTDPTLCRDARAQAWTSLDQDLSLGLDSATITCLARRDTSVGGYKDASDSPDSCGSASFGGHTLWVSTPPPNDASYTGVGGRYALNHAVVFARVDEPTSFFFGRVFGLGARDRIGWATAGPLPTDFALQVFCRNNIAPESGACGGSGATSLVIDGQGGIELIRGDIASNESLKVTATNGGGVILDTGRMFLVNGTCSSALWRCPNGPPSLGGLSDGAPNYDGQNAFYMPPQPVPQYQSPLFDVAITQKDCTGADASHLCVPYRPWSSGTVNAPGDWSCDPAGTVGSNNLCGRPCDYASPLGVCNPPTSDRIQCEARVSGPPSRHLLPNADLTTNTINGNPQNGNNLKYQNVDDNPEATPPDPDTTNPPATSPTDFVYLQNTLGPGQNKSFEFGLRPPNGIPRGNIATVTVNAFKTNGSTLDGTGNQVDMTVGLYQQGILLLAQTFTNISGTPTDYSFNVTSGITNYNALSLRFTFSTPSSGTNASKRAGGVAWAEAYTPNLDPALPPMIPPGYYHSISIPTATSGAASCAIMDPTAVYSGLDLYQKAGIYRFGGGSDAYISVGAGSFLIGDGVTLVFDPNFPDPTGGRGIIIGANGAMLLNTMRVPGTPPCTPTETESTAYNPSQPLFDPAHTPTPSLDYGLPYSSVCAAWAVDSSSGPGLHTGTMLWTASDPTTGSAVPYCADLTTRQASDCVRRNDYGAAGLPAYYRGITFFFSTNSWPATTVRGRFQMSAGGGNCDGSQPGIAFRGVLYAPYDDVIITAGSHFGTVGQILAWTAKFNGACPNLVLDYPYQSTPAPPFLLEPGLGQ